MLRRTVLIALAPLLPAACQTAPPSGADVACGSCAEAFTQGVVVCGDSPSADAWVALSMCACSGACADACTASFCTTMPADQMCSACVASSCSAEATACSND